MVVKAQGHPKTVSSESIEMTFKATQILLDLQKCILSGAIKFVSARSSQGNLTLFEITRASVRITNESQFLLIPLSTTFLNPKILGFLFSTKNSLTWGVKCEKLNSRKSQGVYQISFENRQEWNGHLEIFSRPQAEENSRQHLLLRVDILQKTVVGCPWKLS